MTNMPYASMPDGVDSMVTLCVAVRGWASAESEYGPIPNIMAMIQATKMMIVQRNSPDVKLPPPLADWRINRDRVDIADYLCVYFLPSTGQTRMGGIMMQVDFPRPRILTTTFVANISELLTNQTTVSPYVPQSPYQHASARLPDHSPCPSTGPTPQGCL